MTPEERAAAFVREHRGFDSNGDIWFIACDRAEANLASAIREAEDAALERVAVKLDAQAGDQLKTLWGVAAKRLAQDVRSLKHTKD